MLNLANEKPVSLAEALKLIPLSYTGKPVHLTTLLRWGLTGVLGPGGERVRLEMTRLGGRWLTSAEALQRFSERLTPRFDAPVAPEVRTPNKRQRASDRAAKELERVGI